MKKKTKKEKTSIFIHLFFILFSFVCIVPFIMVVSASFTSVADLARYGFSVLPPKFDFSAYEYLFEKPAMIFKAYGVTLFITLIGTFLSVLFMCMMAYALARDNFKLKGFLTAYIFFPTLFNGGLVSSYIINSRYLHLTDSVWSMILPTMVNVFHIIMLRTFFKQLPEGLFEAAKIDGAGEWRICFGIAMRLSTPVVATISFLGALTRWNEWYRAMLYIRDEDKFPLQYLLQRMMKNINALLEELNLGISSGISAADLPGDNLRMALLVVCIGPMMCFFPFFQKYFTKGMTVGAVKG